MSLVGFDGRPIKSRQQLREEARNMQGKVMVDLKTFEQMKHSINFCLYRTDLIFAVLKKFGMDDELFSEVEAEVTAEYEQIKARMGAQQAGGEQ